MSNILAVAQQGESILNLIAAPVMEVELKSEWLKHLTDAMMATMLARQGVGIAAPQVYVSKRIIIVASRANPRYPDAPDMQPIIMLNPKIIEASQAKVIGQEGCLSVPEQRGDVARAEQIKVRYLNMQGHEIVQEFSGFPARIVQHEIDHLDGILFVERL